MKEDAQAKGHLVETVCTNDLQIKPCAGCMACRTKGECLLSQDDSQRVLKMIQDADAVIMGAPCYWGNIPGQMKLLFDRIVYGMMRDTPRFPQPLMKGKKCILLSTCTTPWPWNIWFKQSRGAIRAMREICRYAGFTRASLGRNFACSALPGTDLKVKNTNGQRSNSRDQH